MSPAHSQCFVAGHIPRSQPTATFCTPDMLMTAQLAIPVSRGPSFDFLNIVFDRAQIEEPVSLLRAQRGGWHRRLGCSESNNTVRYGGGNGKLIGISTVFRCQKTRFDGASPAHHGAEIGQWMDQLSGQQRLPRGVRRTGPPSRQMASDIMELCRFRAPGAGSNFGCRSSPTEGMVGRHARA